ncbi:MAG: hypothetical protein JNJ91_05370 [Flavobacteriales bacterium]|nr:hypothetical protein [Flavobacteriales bacterium]
MDRFKPRSGTPAPYWRHMTYIADSYDRAIRSAFADYLAIADSFIIQGGLITETPSGTSTVYSVTAGHAFYKGELLYFDAHSITKLSSQVVYFELFEDAVDVAPVLNIDGSSDQVMVRRRIRLRVGPVYPLEHMPITVQRKEQLDRLRLKGRITNPGMIMPYFGPLDNFNASGLGIANTEMEGWAVCNGLNGTPDLRGMTLFGATQVPSSGAPTPYAGVHPTPSDPGDKVGKDVHVLEADQLPEHSHAIDFPSDSYWAGIGSAANISGGTGNGIEILPEATEPNETAAQPLEMRQASFAVVYLMSVAN